MRLFSKHPTEVSQSEVLHRLYDAPPPDQYRQIFAALDLPKDAPQVVIGITSAISGEGRTTVALGLARTLAADMDLPVALVEVDLERPMLAARFRIPQAPGLCEVLRGQCRIDQAMWSVSENLSVVPVGLAGRNVSRLLHRLPHEDPFHTPERAAGITILDLPPIINHGYGAMAAGAADATLLVVRAGVTPLAMVREALARLEDVPPQGIIFNAPHSALPRWWAR